MSKNKFNKMGFPEEYGLYDPKNEHENCGFGFIANIKNEPKHEIVHQALEIVHNLDHRGAVGADPLAGDGAGILIQIPDQFLEMILLIMILLFLRLEIMVLEWFFFHRIKLDLI